ETGREHCARRPALERDLLELLQESTTCGEHHDGKGVGIPMRPRAWLTVFGFLTLTLGLQSARASAQFIPAGTVVNVRTIQEVYADTSSPGMRVRALVDYPIVVGNRVVVS